MRLFGKKEEKKSCCCQGNCASANVENVNNTKTESDIKILGSGCAKCIALENATRSAVEQLGLDLKIEHVTDFAEIASYGVMSTPALVLHEKVVSYGKVLSVEDIKNILEKARKE